MRSHVDESSFFFWKAEWSEHVFWQTTNTKGRRRSSLIPSKCWERSPALGATKTLRSCWRSRSALRKRRQERSRQSYCPPGQKVHSQFGHGLCKTVCACRRKQGTRGSSGSSCSESFVRADGSIRARKRWRALPQPWTRRARTSEPAGFCPIAFTHGDHLPAKHSKCRSCSHLFWPSRKASTSCAMSLQPKWWLSADGVQDIGFDMARSREATTARKRSLESLIDDEATELGRAVIEWDCAGRLG